MAHNGTAYLREMAKHPQTFRTVLKPDVKDGHGKILRRYEGHHESDYIAVPRLSLTGGYRLLVSLNNRSARAVLSWYAQNYPGALKA